MRIVYSIYACLPYETHITDLTQLNRKQNPTVCCDYCKDEEENETRIVK